MTRTSDIPLTERDIRIGEQILAVANKSGLEVRRDIVTSSVGRNPAGTTHLVIEERKPLTTKSSDWPIMASASGSIVGTIRPRR